MSPSQPHRPFRHDRKIRGRTFDEVYCDLNLPGIDLLKMNIEGAERWASEGMADSVSSPQHGPITELFELLATGFIKFNSVATSR